MNSFSKALGTLVVLAVVLAGCAADVTARLNEGFTLHVGQTASISGESLKIKFTELIGDSRCPIGVVCVWAGEVTCGVEVTIGNVTEDVVWKQPGLTDEHSRIAYKGYQVAFEVEPYPEQGKTISKDDYRMKIIVSK